MVLKKTITLIALSTLVHPFDLTLGMTCVHGSELYPEAEVKKHQDLPQITENDTSHINKILPCENNDSSQSRERVIAGESFNSNPNQNTKLSVFYISLSSRHEHNETDSRNEAILLYDQNKQKNTNETFEDLLKDLPSKKIRKKRQVKILDKLIEKGNKIRDADEIRSNSLREIFRSDASVFEKRTASVVLSTHGSEAQHSFPWITPLMAQKSKEKLNLIPEASLNCERQETNALQAKL